MAPPASIATVSDLTAHLKEVVEGTFAEVWVAGEVSSLSRPASGHQYFNLKDSRATLACALFRFQAKYQRYELQEGIEIAAKGRISIYEPRGTYQLVVEYFEPLGAGALQAAFEELKQRLAADGLFDPTRKRRLPFLPRRVGIVTSRTGAVIRDIVRVATARFPNIELLLHPVRVQGGGAAGEIAAAIAAMDARGDLDVLIVGRGGGSLEDLWSFNEEVVVRAVAACRTPIVSAVGHETDFTLCDFAADVRAATPSNAAEIAVPVKAELLATLTQRSRSLRLALQRRLEHLAQRIDVAGRALIHQRQRFRDQRDHITVRGEHLATTLYASLMAHRERLYRLAHLLERHSPAARVARAQTRLAGLTPRLRRAGIHAPEGPRQRLQIAAETLHAVSPLAVLTRGYAIATRPESHHPVTDASTLRAGDPLRVRFAQGSAETRVEGTEP
ncbi:MAG: exodeoxyribonuclease VII large subunit [Nitrospirota bacterium]|jgi:exodeoxyribonuclease VII large subunit